MPSAQIPCVEMVALGFRLALAHLVQASKKLQMAAVIQSAEKQGKTAYEAVSHQ